MVRGIRQKAGSAGGSGGLALIEHSLARGLLFNAVALHQFGKDIPSSLSGPHAQLFLAEQLSLRSGLRRPI